MLLLPIGKGKAVNFMFLGLILLVIGVVYLLKNLGYISGAAWSIIWPAILIIFGLWILLRKREEGFFWEERFGWRKKEIKKE